MDSLNKAEKYWDRMAKHLDWVEKKDGAINKLIIEKTKKYLQPSDVVLDLGCGTGTAAIEISSDVKKIFGIDISLKMINRANNKMKKLGITNISFDQATLVTKQFDGDSFDVIICLYLLHLLDDSKSEIQRVNKLLKQGGLFISATPCITGTFFENLLSPLSMIGLVPSLNAFSSSKLINIIQNEGFDVIVVEGLKKSGNQQYIVAKKK